MLPFITTRPYSVTWNKLCPLFVAKRPDNLKQTASSPLLVKDLAVIQILKPDDIQSIIFPPEIHQVRSFQGPIL